MVGAWEHLPAARVPAPRAPHVLAMYGYSAEGLAPGVHRGLPSAGLTLVLSLERPLRTAPTAEAWDAGVRDAQWVSLGGLHTRAARGEQPGRWTGVQLTLHPVGGRRLLGVPASDLPVGSWDARDLVGGEVADVVGYSRRRLTQLLTAETGHGPKTVQRLARFDTARREVVAAASAGASLAQVAARTGYYDQSHLVRDFREFAGLGPSAWLAAEFPNVQGAPAGVAAASGP